MLSHEYLRMLGINSDFSKTMMKTGRRKGGAQLGWEALERANRQFDALSTCAKNRVVHTPASQRRLMPFERQAKLRRLASAAAAARICLDQYLRREARIPERGKFFSPFS